MKPIPAKLRKLGEKCAWCGDKLFATSTTKEPIQLLAKLPVGFQIKAGAILVPVEMKKADRTTHAIVMQPGSEGKRQGWDIMFGACCEDCAASLKQAISEEADGFQLRN